MPCNGKNHRSNCECPFGGTGAASLPKKTPAEAADLFSELPKIPRHYTKNTEHCPFCDEPVFFRQLANHGRAYFNNPGAPWRKHPCTDKLSESYRGPFGPDAKGWPQLTQISAEVLSDSVMKLSGQINNQNFVVFVSMLAFSNIPKPSTYLSESSIQAHPSRDGRFALAVLTPKLEHLLLIGYPAIADTASELA